MTKVILGRKATGEFSVVLGDNDDAGKVRSDFVRMKLNGEFPAGIVELRLVNLDRGTEERAVRQSAPAAAVQEAPVKRWKGKTT